MQLLCLADTEPSEALPALDLLTHESKMSPLSTPVPATLANRFDAIIVDGSSNPRAARTACLALSEVTDVPRLLVLPEFALTALTREWHVSDFVLPGANPSELDLRLRMLRPLAAAAAPDGESTVQPHIVQAAGVVIDETSFTAKVQGRTLDLTYKEFELLLFLAENPGRVFTREQLLSDVWGTDYFGGTRTVDVHVRRLRAKLGEQESLITTVRGVGYGFDRARNDAGDEGDTT